MCTEINVEKLSDKIQYLFMTKRISKPGIEPETYKGYLQELYSYHLI